MRIARQDIENIKASTEHFEKAVEKLGDSIVDVCISLGDIGTQLDKLGKGTILSSLEMEVEAIGTNLKLILEEMENKRSGDDSLGD